MNFLVWVIKETFDTFPSFEYSRGICKETHFFVWVIQAASIRKHTFLF